MPPTKSLYHSVLGEGFDTLPPILRGFHASLIGGEAKGTFSIAEGEGVLRHLAARLMRLPPSSEQVPVHLRVEVKGEQEYWVRRFGTQVLTTTQWSHGGLLIERAGILCFGFHLAPCEEGFRFEFRKCWLLGVLLPSVFAPKVNAEVWGTEAGWWVQVKVEVPLLGLLTQYDGEMFPQ